MHRRCEFLAVVLSLFLLSSVGRASILDQSYDPGAGSGGYSVSSAGKYAQLFQAGISGQVASIDVRALNYLGAATAPLQLDLWTVGGLYPEALLSNLASASLSNASVPSSSGFVSFDLSSSGASFTAGQNYAIVLSTTSSFSYLWEGPSNGTYAYGSGRLVSGSNVYYTMAGQNLDFGFRTFVVEVPEPTALVLVATGVVTLMISARRSRSLAATWLKSKKRQFSDEIPCPPCCACERKVAGIFFAVGR